MPILTIITPTFNAGSFIERCIESVQQQSFRNIEHLIVDGNSSDNTIELVKGLAEKYQNVKWTSEPDKGIYDAMNKGIKLAAGEWVYFLGSDDFFYNNSVLEAVSEMFLKYNQFDILYGNVWHEELQRIYDGAFDIEKILTRNICHQAIFFKHSLFEKVGYYGLKYKLNADYEFNLKCFLKEQLNHKFIPVIVANFSSGGASAILDEAFFSDYPAITTAFVLESKNTFSKKTFLLSKLFRKIIIRKYSPSVIFKYVLCLDKYFFARLFALLLMPVEFVIVTISKKGKKAEIK